MQLETKIIDARLHDYLPKYATPEAAAIDLRACSRDGAQFLSPKTIYPGERVKVGTGIAVDVGSHGIGWHIAAMLLPRSGLGSRGITLGNSPGLIDADYQGEITLAIWNSGEHEYVMQPLDRLAQLVFVPILRPSLKVVSEFSRTTERGAGGFGSTGAA